MSETLWLQPSPLAPGRARRWLAEWCAQWGCTDVEDDAALLVSELITNALVHARTTITVSARYAAGELRVAVADRQPGGVRGRQPVVPAASGQLASPPAVSRQPAEPAADTGYGHGLAIVEALAGEWGVHSHRGGKIVWFTLASAATAPVGGVYALGAC